MIKLPKILVHTLGSDQAANGFLWMIRLGMVGAVVPAAAIVLLLGTDPLINPFLPLFANWGPVFVTSWVIAEVWCFIDRRRNAKEPKAGTEESITCH